MFVQSLVQTVRRNVSRALTSSAADFKDLYVSVQTHEFAGYWQEQITKATSRASLREVIERILNCLVANFSAAHSPRSNQFEERIFVAKELGLRQLLEAIYQDVQTIAQDYESAEINEATLPSIEAIITPPFSNESSEVRHPVLLRFEDLFVLSGMSALMVTHIYAQRELLKNDPSLLELVTRLLAALSIYPKTATAIATSLTMENIPELDAVELLHSILKEWKLHALMSTIQGLQSRYRAKLMEVHSLARSPRGRTPPGSRTDSGPISPQNSIVEQSTSSPRREPSSSAESLGELRAVDPYLKLQDMAAEQVKDLEIREVLINLGTLSLRLERVHKIASKAYEVKRLKELQKFRERVEDGCQAYEKQLTEIQETQKDQESRFEQTKSVVSEKLNKELDDLKNIKENTARERSILEKELEDLRLLMTTKEAALESLKQKEQHISELFCQISQEIDSLNLSYNMLSTDSLTAIKEGQKVLEQLCRVKSTLLELSQMAEVDDTTLDDQVTSEDVANILEDYTARALPKFYQTEHDLIKLGCDRLKSQSPTARGISPYRPTIAQTSILLDRQAKYVENAMKELSLVDMRLSGAIDSSSYEKGYMDCRSLIKSNHQLIFA